jgi:hypothetical protein
MGKYGQAAVKAVALLNTKTFNLPIEAWNQATIEIFGEGTSSQAKGCPRSAFIGLCEEGLVKGVDAGKYALKSTKNKDYAIKAINLIKKEPSLTNDMNQLWNQVNAGDSKVHNSQMDVVVTLWKNNLLVIS